MTRGRLSQGTDAELLQAHIDGDPGAFGTLIDRHLNQLWSVALRTTGDYEDAADALQEAMLSIHLMAPTYRADSALVSWLHRIVLNASLDKLRRNRPHWTVPLPEYERMFLADPHDYTGDVDLSMSIGRALDVLPDDQRAAVVAVDLEGLSVAEAAEQLGIAAGTVKSRCARGRLKLALVLGHLRDDDC